MQPDRDVLFQNLKLAVDQRISRDDKHFGVGFVVDGTQGLQGDEDDGLGTVALISRLEFLGGTG